MEKLEKNKEKILKCAREIIISEGFESLTISRLVKTCRISNRSFYEVFPSKSAFISEIEKIFHGANLSVKDDREIIIETAMDCFARHGYHGIDMDEIARASHVSRSMIYKYFKTKDELLESCILRQYKIIKEFAGGILQNTVNPSQALEAYISGYCDFLSSSYDRTLFSEVYNQVHHNEKLKSYTKELQLFFIEAFENVLLSGIEKGLFKSNIDAHGIAVIMLAAVNGLSLFARIDPTLDIKKSIKHSMLTILNNSILIDT